MLRIHLQGPGIEKGAIYHPDLYTGYPQGIFGAGHRWGPSCTRAGMMETGYD